MPNSNLVATGKPKVGGAVFCAPEGTALPTDATTTLNEAFKDLGYISEDGITNSPNQESEDIKAWGGDVVASVLTSKSDEFKFTLLESTNVEVLKVVYGDGNVTGTLSTGIKVSVNAQENKPRAWVIETIEGDALRRIAIPHGKVTTIGDIVYKDDEAVGYEVTVKAFPNANGDTHYEYTKTATAE